MKLIRPTPKKEESPQGQTIQVSLDAPSYESLKRLRKKVRHPSQDELVGLALRQLEGKVDRLMKKKAKRIIHSAQERHRKEGPGKTSA